MSLAIEFKNVGKTYPVAGKDPFVALQPTNLQIEQGTIHGLLGPNGAGKSTTIALLGGMLTPDQGSVEICGIDLAKDPVGAKRCLGIVPQELVVEPAFTVKEVLYYAGGMYGVSREDRLKRIPEVLEALELGPQADKKAMTLSGGMKRRLMVAKAMLHRPRVLVLDEPTAGVDVGLRQRMWDLVRTLHREGTTILFTTHYLEEAEQLCERITLLNKGKIVKEGSLQALQQEFSGNLLSFELYDANQPLMEGARQNGKTLELPYEDLGQAIALVSAHYGKNLKTVQNQRVSLEQIFLTLTR
jgi:ABC-2 type transport system ATP-binding protein